MDKMINVFCCFTRFSKNEDSSVLQDERSIYIRGRQRDVYFHSSIFWNIHNEVNHSIV